MKEQEEAIFAAQTTWFHVFKDMIDSGDMARLPATAVKIYLVIKAHTNFTTGCSFPALETIVEKSGVSRAQVMRDLKALEDKGYLTKEKRGRSNVYHLREKIEIKDAAGRPTAVATWDYLPGFGRLDSANLAGLPGNDKTLARQIRTENLSSGPGFGQFGERNPGETAGLAVRDPTQGLSKGKTAEPELAADLPESLYETKR